MTAIPIIGQVIEQKLIISFIKQADGAEGSINFDFDPPIFEAISPEQRAAINVAEQVIKLFGLSQNQQPQENYNGKEIN